MINLRVHMIRTSGQYNAVSAGFLEISQRFFPLFLHVCTCSLQFFPCKIGGCGYLLLQNFKTRTKRFDQSFF